MKSVGAQINAAYRKKVLESLDKVTRKTALDLQAELQSVTPVDTGRARSNWLPSIGNPRQDTTESTSGSPTISFSGYKLGDVIYLANNLPYIKRLNEGSSKQAPSRYVDMAVERATQKAKQAIRALIK